MFGRWFCLKDHTPVNLIIQNLNLCNFCMLGQFLITQANPFIS